MDPFRDFYLYEPRYAFFHSPGFFSFQGWPYTYPAPVAMFYRLFYLFPHSTNVFVGTLFVTFVAAALWFARSLVRRGISPVTAFAFMVVVFTCSYPFFYEFEQANMEFIVWIFVSGGLFAYIRGKSYTAAVCFAIAGAMKIFPLILLGLFLSRKQYRQFVVGLIVGGATTIVSLWILCPDLLLSWRGTEKGIATFKQIYMLGYNEVGFDHSLFGLYKLATSALHIVKHVPLATPSTLALILTIYLPIVAIGGIVLYFRVIRKLPLINQVICLTVASILLPPVSYDYTLIHLYGPWALLVIFAIEARNRITPGLAAMFVCFAVLLSPLTEIIIHGHSIGGQIRAVTLIILLVLALTRPLSSLFDSSLQNTIPRYTETMERSRTTSPVL